MFSSKLQVYLKKPSLFRLRRVIDPEQAQKLLESRSEMSYLISASPSNVLFQEANQILLRDKEKEKMRYEKSVLWSRQFTPFTFVKQFLLPMGFIVLFILYIHNIHHPEQMLRLMNTHGIRLPDDARLQGWLQEHTEKDEVLTQQAYSLDDLDKLYKEGLLPGGSPKQQAITAQKAEKRKTMYSVGYLKQFSKKQFASF